MGVCLGGRLRSVGVHGHEGTFGYGFHCPGCKHMHVVWTKARPDQPNGHVWGFNGNEKRPTFTPSLLLSGHTWVPPVTAENYAEWERKPWPQTQVPKICHSFIADGRIQFLGDCTHELKGQTVEIPLWPEEEGSL